MKVLVFVDLEALGEDFIKMCKDILPEWRCNQMMGYKHLRGQVQSAVAWILVEKLKDNSERLKDKWVYNEHGKPYFEGRNDLFFSISHCKSAVAAVVAEEEIGIDIEEISRYKESLVKYVLSEEESLELKDDDLEHKAEKFIKIWTQKEAAFKYYGTGITHDIKDILKRDEVAILSEKIGDDKWLSVATADKKDKNTVEMTIVSAEQLYGIIEKWRNFR